jgi:glycosyltransferase involved in cell wall biosynthesis
LIALHRIESELEKNLNFYKPKLWVLMPVFNEANGLVSWIRTVDRELHFMDTTFVISDDGSSDGIGEKLMMEVDFSKYVFLGDGINRGRKQQIIDCGDYGLCGADGVPRACGEGERDGLIGLNFGISYRINHHRGIGRSRREGDLLGS